MKVSIIIPAKNEEEVLPKTINEVFSKLKNIEVIVVNDHSTDKTEQVVKELMKKHKLLTL